MLPSAIRASVPRAVRGALRPVLPPDCAQVGQGLLGELGEDEAVGVGERYPLPRLDALQHAGVCGQGRRHVAEPGVVDDLLRVVDHVDDSVHFEVDGGQVLGHAGGHPAVAHAPVVGFGVRAAAVGVDGLEVVGPHDALQAGRDLVDDLLRLPVLVHVILGEDLEDQHLLVDEVLEPRYAGRGLDLYSLKIVFLLGEGLVFDQLLLAAAAGRDCRELRHLVVSDVPLAAVDLGLDLGDREPVLLPEALGLLQVRRAEGHDQVLELDGLDAGVVGHDDGAVHENLDLVHQVARLELHQHVLEQPAVLDEADSE